MERLYMPYKHRFGNNFMEAKVVDMEFKENKVNSPHLFVPKSNLYHDSNIERSGIFSNDVYS